MNAPVRPFADLFLTEEERLSSTWQSVQRHLERMLAKKRLENDNPNLTEVETATLRGHLSCLKAILALGSRPSAMTATVARPNQTRPDLGAKYG